MQFIGEYEYINNFQFNNNTNVYDIDNEFLNYLLETNTQYNVTQQPLRKYKTPPLLQEPPKCKNKKKTKTKHIHKRAPRKFVPEELKDEKYYKYRAKNTEAARLSRKRAKKFRIIKEKKVKLTLEKLNQDNNKLIEDKIELTKQIIQLLGKIK